MLFPVLGGDARAREGDGLENNCGATVSSVASMLMEDRGLGTNLQAGATWRRPRNCPQVHLVRDGRNSGWG